MGLFDKRDKKRKDDFDSPVEQVDLGAVAPARPPGGPVAKAPEPAATPPSTTAPAPASASAAAPAPAPAAATAAPISNPMTTTTPLRPAPRPAPSPSMETDDYGIEKAIELMRTLPSDNVELVVQVVKFSLESVGIKLPTIIEDATRRQKDITGKITVRKDEITELEQEIRTRKDEIEALEEDHRETTMVRERLELAEQIGQAGKKKPAAPEPRDPGPDAKLGDAKADGKSDGKTEGKSDGKSDAAATAGRPSRQTAPQPTLAPLTPTKK